ncbi:hypothetical protein AbraIFM66951_001439 [Aspergillus brasiliensis]|uniref:Uncharacterized protein n=1 Tax=Aspergillus brasiliensis TaxID=319629 RepID=A0A9W5YQI3_9EURO|nr:hypothetical protein AbraCBS73388_005497 [Aspergillus brasiliensis]GKZ42353.1 hypothetical protein AbraIFM66951_001439 [Aspergillus brasiliensis]
MDESIARERVDRCHKLARIEQLIRQTPSQHIAAADLEAANIRHLPLSLNGDIEHHPHYFQQYPEELPLPEKEDEEQLLEFPPDPNHILWDTRDMETFLTNHFCNSWEYASDEYSHNPPPSGIYREIGDYKFGQLLESYRVQLAMLESEAIGDDRLLRGEIMTITDIMAARLRTKSLRLHIIAPMLVISLMGPRHARVLEADFDGEMLNIRASKLYNFSRKNTESAQLITRYWLGGACGQTKLESMKYT